MEYSSSFSNPSSSQSRTTGTEKEKKKNKGGGGKLSTDPQSVAARRRRHRISDRFKILQSLVPGCSKMDTVSMLEEAIQHVKFLKTQIWLHQAMIDLLHDPTSYLQPNIVPFYPQNADFCNNCFGGEDGLWVPGEEDGGFDASSMQG